MKRNMIILIWVIVFTIAFPYAVTIIFMTVGNKQMSVDIVYEPEKSGQWVVVKTGNKKEKMDVEKFIPCVLMSIMDIKDNEEALKAQAVIIRSIIRYNMQGLSTIDAGKIDLSYISYAGMEKMWKDKFSDNYNYLMKIVNNTSCQVIKYEGHVILPYYHNISAGMTRIGNQPYLISASSEGDLESEDFLKIVYFTNEEFTEKVEKSFSDIEITDNNPLESIQIIERDEAGYVCKLQIGGMELTGEEFAQVFNLKSTYFQIEPFNGNIRIITKGEGHGYGMSLYGAGVYGNAGWSYIQILQHYFSESIIIE